MKFISLIISIGFLTSCFSLLKTKSSNEKMYGVQVSDGVKKRSIGPLKVVVPKGWCFNESQWDKKRFLLEMTPGCDFPFAKYVVHFTYWKETKDKSFVEIQYAKKEKNAVFSPFHIGPFKGQSVRYETDHQEEIAASAGLGENDALLIILSAPKGNLTKMEKALKLILH